MVSEVENLPAGIELAGEIGSRSGSSSGVSPDSEIIETTDKHPFWVGWHGMADWKPPKEKVAGTLPSRQ
jgi:hypothetical protein